MDVTDTHPPSGWAAGRWGYLACAWCLIFAAAHVYWAVGGTIGLASSAGADLATRRPLWFVAVGLWGTAAVLTLGAAFGMSLVRRRPGAGLRRAMVILGVAAGATAAARGLVLELFLLGDFDSIATSVGPLETRWSLVLWNPWFFVGGIAFLLATRDFARVTRPRPPSQSVLR